MSPVSCYAGWVVMIVKLWSRGRASTNTLALFSHMSRLIAEFLGSRATGVALACAGIFRFYWPFVRVILPSEAPIVGRPISCAGLAALGRVEHRHTPQRSSI